MAALTSLLALCAVLLSLLVCAAATAAPVGGCDPDQCSSLDLTRIPEIALGTFDYAKNASWQRPQYREVAFYLGRYNKRYKKSQMDDKWQPAVNYERYDEEGSFVLKQFQASSLQECCDTCRTQADCMVYQLDPDLGVDGRFMGTGLCSLRKGGTVAVDGGPFALSLPFSGSADEQSGGRANIKATWVGGRCNPYVEDDPHFMGARGTKFDFNGQLDKSYCLATDTRIQINAGIRGYKAQDAAKGIRSWIKEVGILWVDKSGKAHTAQLRARNGKDTVRGKGFLASVMLDGNPLPVPSAPSAASSKVEKGDLVLTFLGTRKQGPYEVDHFALSVKNLLDMSLSLRVAHKLLRTPDDAQTHFNLVFDRITATDKIHGVLGQTYRNTPEQTAKALKYSELSRLLHAPIQADGATGKGFLEGIADDYVTSGITSPDCKFSAFAKE